MKVWGSLAYVKQTMLDKLEAKYDMCLFVGYPKETNGYKFYNSLEQKVLLLKHVVFMEKESLVEDIGSKVELREVQSAQTDVDHLTGAEAVIHSDEEIVVPFETQALHRASRTRTVLERYEFLISEQRDVKLIEDDEPTTYEESMNSLDFDKWLTTMKS